MKDELDYSFHMQHIDHGKCQEPEKVMLAAFEFLNVSPIATWKLERVHGMPNIGEALYVPAINPSGS
jgi:hypothetical protein